MSEDKHQEMQESITADIAILYQALDLLNSTHFSLSRNDQPESDLDKAIRLIGGEIASLRRKQIAGEQIKEFFEKRPPPNFTTEK